MSTESKGFHRDQIEPRSALFAILTTVAMSIGGIVEIAPMFTAQAGPEPMEGINPYTPLQVTGRDIYIREGCYVCHSQMIRPFRSETLRYGEWSRAGEYQWDHPFLLGSKRTGPDLARVGGKYPDTWHAEHMRDARVTSPGSIMPQYPWLFEWTYDPAETQASMTALARVGLPYDAARIAGAPEEMKTEAAAIGGRLRAANYPIDDNKDVVALIAYLQHLGVDGTAAIKKAKAEKAAGGQ